MGAVPVGLVGAGPWASMVHAPMLAGGPDTTLVGVWARRPEAAARLAGRHGATACSSFDELLAGCDAVAFAVPPAVQAELAVRAAGAGKALLLEKPVADDVASAERLADAVGAAGVPSLLLLTWRFAAPVRALIETAATAAVLGGRAVFVSDALRPGGMFATPWRLERGALLDLGPHVIDALDATLGPVVEVHARGGRAGWVGLLLEHQGGAVSTAPICATAAPGTLRAGIEVVHSGGIDEVDCAAAIGPSVFATVAATFAAVVAGVDTAPDVHRGVYLQRLITRAEAQLGS